MYEGPGGGWGGGKEGEGGVASETVDAAARGAGATYGGKGSVNGAGPGSGGVSLGVDGGAGGGAGAAVDAGGAALAADVGTSSEPDVRGADPSSSAVDALADPAKSSTRARGRMGKRPIASTYTSRCRKTPPRK